MTQKNALIHSQLAQAHSPQPSARTRLRLSEEKQGTCHSLERGNFLVSLGGGEGGFLLTFKTSRQLKRLRRRKQKIQVYGSCIYSFFLQLPSPDQLYTASLQRCSDANTCARCPVEAAAKLSITTVVRSTCFGNVDDRRRKVGILGAQIGSTGGR